MILLYVGERQTTELAIHVSAIIRIGYKYLIGRIVSKVELHKELLTL